MLQEGEGYVLRNRDWLSMCYLLRLLTYDGETAFALIFNEAVAIVVDASYSIDASCKTWINEPLGAVMIIGYLEEREVRVFDGQQH